MIRTVLPSLIFICSLLFHSCSEKPLRAPEEFIRNQFGAEACHIKPYTRIDGEDTFNVVTVQLVNAREAFSQLEEWQINVAVAFAFYQQVDKSLLAGYDGISGVITKTEATDAGYNASSKEYALSVDGFAEIDSVQKVLMNLLDKRAASGNFNSSRNLFDTVVTDQNLVSLDSAIDRSHQLGGMVLKTMMIGFRYVTIPEREGMYIETEIAEEVNQGWIVNKFIIDKATGKIVGFRFWINA